MLIDTSPKHILLTGGTGFFGKALLRHWKQQVHAGIFMERVTLLSRNPELFVVNNPDLVNHSWLELVKGDICEPSSLPRGKAFTHILHAAADSTAGSQLKPGQRFDQIVNGTRNMLDLAVACGAQRFLLTSSGGVYGAQTHDMQSIKEDCHSLPDPMDVANSYSVAKRMAEHLCAIYSDAHGFTTVVARCFSFVGPDLPLHAHFAIGNFIRDALQADCITVQGDGSPLRTYLDQRDLARWLTTMLFKGRASQAYNLGSDQAVSILDLANIVRNVVSPRKPIKVMDNLLANSNSNRNRYIPCIRKAQVELGLTLEFDLKEAIKFTANAHLHKSISR
jgi:dTDP-glucose 4,6-dehydratase